MKRPTKGQRIIVSGLSGRCLKEDLTKIRSRESCRSQNSEFSGLGM